MTKFEKYETETVIECIYLSLGTQIVENNSGISVLNTTTLNNVHDYVVKRCNDKKNMLSFIEAGQLEMKLWLIMKLMGNT